MMDDGTHTDTHTYTQTSAQINNISFILADASAYPYSQHKLNFSTAHMMCMYNTTIALFQGERGKYSFTRPHRVSFVDIKPYPPQSASVVNQFLKPTSELPQDRRLI